MHMRGLPPSTKQVLLVDDDRDLMDLLVWGVKRAGLEALPAYDGPTGLRLFKERQPDLVVLDINLGGPNGLEVLKELRQHSQVPVIMLTALDSEDDKVRGLQQGADDYVTKPFSLRELMARINAHLRRSRQTESTPRAPEAQLTVGPLTLNPAERTVTRNGELVNLTRTEFEFLRCLMLRAGTVVPTATLLKEVWNYPHDQSGADLVRVTLFRLRQKLEEDPARPTLLHTSPGVGVLLKPQPSP
jgi:two-component system response regulator VicR